MQPHTHQLCHVWTFQQNDTALCSKLRLTFLPFLQSQNLCFDTVYYHENVYSKSIGYIHLHDSQSPPPSMKFRGVGGGWGGQLSLRWILQAPSNFFLTNMIHNFFRKYVNFRPYLANQNQNSLWKENNVEVHGLSVGADLYKSECPLCTAFPQPLSLLVLSTSKRGLIYLKLTRFAWFHFQIVTDM